MELTVEIVGLNLERLLTQATEAGIIVRGAERMEPRRIRLRISADAYRALSELCGRYGWEAQVVARSMPLRIMGWLKRRPMLIAAAALFWALMLLSSNMIWRIRIEQAGKDIGEVQIFLSERGIEPGTMKAAVSVSQLRDALMLRLPDLAHVSVAYEGSTLVIDCQPALEGEHAFTDGEMLDLVALEDGVITRMVVHSGTPLVQIGQAVRAGDVLIKGEERGEKQSVHPVQAQGEVVARVWARGDARASRYWQRTVETGAVRRRVTMCSPWHRKVVSDAQPFSSQDVSVEVEPVVGLFLPFWREIELYAETMVIREPRSESDAASMAQGAAQQMAKNKCPSGVQILDKWVEYSMIDNEYVYATVVLEYERNIAVRAQSAHLGP